MNSKFYTNVFELLLRLRANYLWPAMWDNAFNEDDPENPRLADEYGIVMGTSHHEPMMRAQQGVDDTQRRSTATASGTTPPTPTCLEGVLARRHRAQQELREHRHDRHARRRRRADGHDRQHRVRTSSCSRTSSPTSGRSLPRR